LEIDGHGEDLFRRRPPWSSNPQRTEAFMIKRRELYRSSAGADYDLQGKAFLDFGQKVCAAL
jgi:hypothetical protein